jgi:hypothetical protein
MVKIADGEELQDARHHRRPGDPRRDRRCRQKLAEFAAPEVVVTMATVDGKTLRMTVGDLLPGRFVADHMDRARPGTS